jgi:TetR/AcrR family transcriptional repressor of lmrAB and yxaGH operons
MKKGEISRAKLVDTTGRLLRKQGYHATGLAQIVDESGAPRGSLYFYFPGGKEELACEALDATGAWWRARLEEVVAAAPDPGAAAEAVCRELADDLAGSGYELGCPLATVALEAASTSPEVRRTCAKHFEGWEQLVAKKLVEAGVPAEAASAGATFVLSAVEGASLLARVKRDPGPLLQTGAILRSMFHALGRAGA